jgi:hypothetical protein
VWITLPCHKAVAILDNFDAKSVVVQDLPRPSHNETGKGQPQMKIKTEEKDRRFQQSVLNQRRARRINNASHAHGLSRTTISNLAAAGKIRLIKIGGRTLVPESKIDRLVEGAP